MCMKIQCSVKAQQLSQNAMLVEMACKWPTAIPECLASTDGM